MPFRDVPGHRRIVDLLARSIARGSLPPSLIFAGPPAATRPAALAVAQAVNCLKAAAGSDACGSCSACSRIGRGVHPDVVLVEPGDTGSIKVEQVREVVDRAAYRPFEGRRRVVIVDRAEALMPSAQNALLKTLEEPPSSSAFILLTDRPDTLLSTVLSRCIRLAFAREADATVDAAALAVAQRVLAHAAAGTEPRRRLEGARELLANTGRGSAADRAQVAAHVDAVGSLLRDAALLGARADAARLANPGARGAIEGFARVYQGERGTRAYDAVTRARTALDQHAGVKVVADWLALEL